MKRREEELGTLAMVAIFFVGLSLPTHKRAPAPRSGRWSLFPTKRARGPSLDDARVLGSEPAVADEHASSTARSEPLGARAWRMTLPTSS